MNKRERIRVTGDRRHGETFVSKPDRQRMIWKRNVPRVGSIQLQTSLTGDGLLNTFLNFTHFGVYSTVFLFLWQIKDLWIVFT